MKYWLGLPVALVAAGALFTACGDESATELVKAESYASGGDLPKCDASYKGYFAVVPSESEVYVCAETEQDGAKAWEWKSVGGSTSATPAVTKFDCKAEELADKSGYKLVCNGDSLAVIKNGTKGEKGEVSETNAGCTVENLADGSGVKFTCGDKSVEVKTGESGKAPESSNSVAPESSNGGVSGSSSSAAITPETLEQNNACSIVYSGAGVLVYDCGNGMGFAAEAYSTDFPTWKGLSRLPYVVKDGSGWVYGGRVRPRIIDALDGVRVIASDQVLDGGTGEGLVYEDDDVYYAEWRENLVGGGKIEWVGVSPNLIISQQALEGSEPAAPPTSMEGSLYEYYGFKGKATLKLSEDVNPNYDGPYYVPMAGVSLYFNEEHAATVDWGGFCLTYSSEKEMNVYVGNNDSGPNGMVAVLPSTNGQEKTVSIPWNRFNYPRAELYPDIPPYEFFLNMLFNGSDGLGIQYVSFAFVEATKAGTYENSFGLFEFGAYGKCSGNTIVKLKKDLAAQKVEGTFTDPNNDKVTYKTVTIGSQTWLAENLKVKPVSEIADATGAGKTEKLYACLDDEETCKVVGYTWEVAMGYLDGNVPVAEDVEFPVQGLCPEGWHMPSYSEWYDLITTVSKKYAEEVYGSAAGMSRPPYDEEFAAYVLRSKEGWPEAGWDLLGLGLEPNHKESLRSTDAYLYLGQFWTPEAYGEGAAGVIYVGTDYIEDDDASTSEYSSVRCVKTEEGVDYSMLGLR